MWKNGEERGDERQAESPDERLEEAEGRCKKNKRKRRKDKEGRTEAKDERIVGEKRRRLRGRG